MRRWTATGRWRAFPLRKMTPEERIAHRIESRMAEKELAQHERPSTRLDCLPGGPNEARPCPWVSCRHHLALDVSQETGAIKVMMGWDDGRPTCALDEADRHGLTLEDIGKSLNLTRERVRQIEVRGFLRAQREGARIEREDDETAEKREQSRTRAESRPWRYELPATRSVTAAAILPRRRRFFTRKD